MKLIKNQIKNNLPNFIIIGAMKCGTTSLHYYLNSHPDIFMSREKELTFFVESENWEKGIEWYKSQFTGKAKIYGEASPAYTKYPIFQNVAQKMYSVVPNIKLIYIVRDPIKRIISQYLHRWANGTENQFITEALQDFRENDFNSYVSRSRYYFQLEQYLQYYSSNQILVISAEDLFQFPKKTLTQVFNFLEVSLSFEQIKFQNKIHKTKDKRRKNKLGILISHLPIFNQIDKLPSNIEYHIDKLIYFPFSTSVKIPQIDLNLRQQLIDYFKDDIDKLKNFTGKDFQQWDV